MTEFLVKRRRKSDRVILKSPYHLDLKYTRIGYIRSIRYVCTYFHSVLIHDGMERNQRKSNKSAQSGLGYDFISFSTIMASLTGLGFIQRATCHHTPPFCLFKTELNRRRSLKLRRR